MFDYELSDKASKAKLIKGAKRSSFVVQPNKTSTNLVFCAGSWQKVAIPAVKYWNEIKGEQTWKVGDTLIRVGGVKAGTDATGKKYVDAQVVFYVDRDKVVCHMYNTTQLILVNGRNYSKLVDTFLIPFFKSKIEESKKEIDKVNEGILVRLGPKRSSVKYKGGLSFPCNRCDYACKTISTLNKHKTSEHALSFDASKKSIEPRHSTRNNSIVGNLILEDLSYNK